MDKIRPDPFHGLCLPVSPIILLTEVPPYSRAVDPHDLRKKENTKFQKKSVIRIPPQRETFPPAVLLEQEFPP